MNAGESARPKLVVGLGNPGTEYAGTRHNIGFAVLDRVAGHYGSSWRKKWRFNTEAGKVDLPDGSRVVFARPLTFMNRSGAAVAALVKWLKQSPAELLVVVDDVDLPLGRMKLRLSGGSGGHRGLASIIEALGNSEQFARLRIGIGRSGRPGADTADHVLGRFAPHERAAVEQVTAAAAEAVICSLEKGLTAAMNQFNRKMAEPPAGTEERGKTC